MNDIECMRQDGILMIRMIRGNANAIRRSMVEELNSAVDEAACDDSIRGLVLASGVSGFFSSGFDVAGMAEYDRETLAILIARFIDLYWSLYLLPKPTVAAVSGHAYAGGAILALACDVRIFAAGAFGFALNGIDLGVALPPGVVRMLANEVGAARAREILLTGEKIPPGRAMEIGLAHELAEHDRVAERAVERCRVLVGKPSAAFTELKRSLREVSGRYTPGEDHRVLEHFLDQWFSEEARSRRQALLEPLSADDGGNPPPA